MVIHLGCDKDEEIQDLHKGLPDMLVVNESGITKGWVDKDFIVNDSNVQEQLRTMNSNTDRFQIYHDKKDELPHNRFMEISDFHCYEWINTSPMESMKSKLDNFTVRESIEEDWETLTKFNMKEQNQYQLCYNLLLQACLYKYVY